MPKPRSARSSQVVIPPIQFNLFAAPTVAEQRVIDVPQSSDKLFAEHINADFATEIGSLDEWMNTRLSSLITRWDELWERHVYPSYPMRTSK